MFYSTSNIDTAPENFKKQFFSSLFFPVIFVLFLWAIKLVEVYTNSDFAWLGVKPLSSKGLIGIITSPFIHGSYSHLFDNSIPLLVLGTTIFFFYREVAYKIVILSWFMTGFWVWFMARDALHIGASGLVYSWASFIFFSGVMRKNKNLLAISLLITFLYGSMVWGIFPIKVEISWESHLMGGLSGLVLAIYYKDFGPESKTPDWMDEDDEEQEEQYNEDEDYPVEADE